MATPETAAKAALPSTVAAASLPGMILITLLQSKYKSLAAPDLLNTSPISINKGMTAKELFRIDS